ncbi:hypothetical protein BCR34DRAFT_603310 [Clohesyomyces aquaticus]|uniref:Uncharacterized protein n=1 Tax=Clohesyomyces aquaticus TaxID=1231657 RepID=A0A1Y1ZFP1_9PLEO|nr:hypothetical protein BCR34DRAFT_603310 [Clohesyomyces aquaticus]
MSEPGPIPNSYFAVVDIGPNNSVIYAAEFSTEDRNLAEFYQKVNPQPEGVIRIILDGVSVSEQYPFEDPPNLEYSCRPSEGYRNLPVAFEPCPLYYISNTVTAKMHHSPFALRRLISADRSGEAYSFRSFALHESPCEFLPWHANPKIPDAPYLEMNDMYVANVTEEMNQPMWVIYSFSTGVSRNKNGPCTSSNWRALKAIKDALCSPYVVLPRYEGMGNETGKWAILGTLLASLRQTLQTTSAFYEWYARYLSRNRNHPSSIPDQIFDLPKQLRTIGKSVHQLANAVRLVVNNLEATLRKDPKYTSTGIPVILADIQSQCHISELQASSMIEDINHQIQAILDDLNRSQAASVIRLTVLAAFFLPLSLAAGVLSMQTRFSNLKMLLFDFGGVVSLLGAISTVFAFTIRYLTGKYSLHDSSKIQALVAGVLAPISMSWILGMLKNVRFGLIVLGIEAGVILVPYVILTYIFPLYTLRKSKKRKEGIYQQLRLTETNNPPRGTRNTMDRGQTNADTV